MKMFALHKLKNIYMVGIRAISTSCHIDVKKKSFQKFEFTKENELRAQAIMSWLEDGEKNGALMPLLELAQRQYGWLPFSAIEKVAEMLNLKPFEVFTVASFYTTFRMKPTGKYRIQVCTTTSCYLRGSDDIANECKKILKIDFGETTKDMKFTLSKWQCCGACVNAPVMAVNDDYYEDLKPDDVKQILEDLQQDRIPPPGPRSGRYCCEPKCGLTTLKCDPPPPGYKMQKLD